MKILIADDHLTNQKLVRAVLKSQAYEVAEAVNGQEALDWLTRITTPGVALLDLEMPILNGFEVCRRIRERADVPPLYLILLTVQDTEMSRTKAVEVGANDFIAKPFDHLDLIERVKVGVEKVTSVASR